MCPLSLSLPMVAITVCCLDLVYSQTIAARKGTIAIAFSKTKSGNDVYTLHSLKRNWETIFTHGYLSVYARADVGKHAIQHRPAHTQIKNHV
jgi:hypothetical protein